MSEDQPQDRGPVANGREVKALLRRHLVDAGFRDDVLSVRRLLEPEPRADPS